MKSMTYGTVPEFPDFAEAFDREVRHAYRIDLGGSDSKAADNARITIGGDYDCDELYDLVNILARRWESGSDWAGDFASSILTTLGFEWV